MPSKGGKGKGKASFSKRHAKPSIDNTRNKKFPSRLRRMLHSQGIPWATSRAQELVIKLVDCYIEDFTRKAIIFAGKKKTIQGADVEAAMENAGISVV